MRLHTHIHAHVCANIRVCLFGLHFLTLMQTSSKAVASPRPQKPFLKRSGTGSPNHADPLAGEQDATMWMCR